MNAIELLLLARGAQHSAASRLVYVDFSKALGIRNKTTGET
jgi:hypothetical protein